MRANLFLCVVALLLAGCGRSTRYVITQSNDFGGTKVYTTDSYSVVDGGVRFVDPTTGRTVTLLGTMSIVEEAQP